MSPVRPLLRRNQLANALAQDLAGESLVDYSSGMFLAAPRRTDRLVGRIDTRRLLGWKERAPKALARAPD